MKLYDNINEVALSNYGLITSAQASELGVRLKDLLEWVKIGRLEKCWRGVYRLVHYLPTEYDRYAEALATVGKNAMIWGESVLAMHNLAMVNPDRIEVATTHRVRKKLPVWISLVRLQEDSPSDDFNGIRCQPLSAAFRHCHQIIMPQRLAEAIRDAEKKGLLGYSEAKKLKKEFPL
jgi:predicted transcriptional regulator of viral defense system